MTRKFDAWIGLLALFLAACVTTTERLTPVANPPALMGKWTGEWGGTMVHPIEMEVEKQDGVKVTGTMTFILHSGRSTHRMSGTIGAKPDGSVWVVLDVEGRDFPLKVLSEKRLEGTGRSPMHYGPVTLNRQ